MDRLAEKLGPGEPVASMFVTFWDVPT